VPGLRGGRGGLRGHQVLPAGWSAHHHGVGDSFATTRVSLHRRTATTADDNGGWSRDAGPTAVTAPPAIWTGMVRLQALLSGSREAEAVGQQVSSRSYSAAASFTADPPMPPVRAGRDGDTLQVLANPDDPAMVGRWLRVADVKSGSQIWDRELVCTDDLTANNPPESPEAVPAEGA